LLESNATAAVTAASSRMPTSYRIWWLIAGCALAIGIAIEADTPSARAAAETAAAPSAAQATALAARPRRDRGA